MARPQLTPHEALLLNAIKTQDRSTLKIAMWSYLISAGAIAAWGVAINEMVIVFIAFFIVVAFRILEERTQDRWVPHWRSLLEKLDGCCDGVAASAGPEGAKEIGLTNCADCQGIVSKKAHACPHCGCPSAG
jgi:hypothetical protein